MLQAQIDIVDEAGHTEESVTIVGSGRIALGTRQAGGYLHATEAAPDFAVIAKDGDRLSIEVKVANALQRDTGSSRSVRSISRRPRMRRSRSSSSCTAT